MNDYGAMEAIAQIESRGHHVCLDRVSKKARLPTHVIRVQGVRAYSLLGLIIEELTGLKALKQKRLFPSFRLRDSVKGKLDH